MTHFYLSPIAKRFVFVIIALLWLTPVYVLAQQPITEPPTVKLDDGWQYRWGDSPVDENGLKSWLLDTPDNAGWQNFTSAEQLDERNANILWMRIPLAEGQWRDPSLFFDSVDQGLEVYLEQDLIYSAGLIDRTGREPALGTIHHLVLLPDDYAGKTLNLRFYSQYNTIGPRTGVIIGSRADHLLNILNTDIDRFVMANLLLVIGLAALAFYITFLDEKAFLGLAIFALSTGLFVLWRTQLIELFVTNTFLQEYSKIGAVFLMPVGLALFFEQIIGPGPYKIVRRLWQIQLLYAIIAIGLSLLGVVQLLNTILPFEALAAITLIVLVAISIKEAFKGNVDARFFTVGYGLLLFFALLEIFDDLGLIALPRRVLHWGILGFVLVLVLIMLRRYRQAVIARAELKNIQQELETAHQIQQSLLPATQPPWTAPQMVCYTAPAQEMGGDLYNYHAFSDTHFALVVGDVSGKGMSAALLMGVSLSSLNSTLSQTSSPGHLLAQLDHILAPYTRATNQNCAMCYVDLNLNGNSATLKTANAGCIAPIIKRKNGSLEWINIGGIPLGVGLGKEAGYKEACLTLYPEDTLILVSDGIIEAHNEDFELFGFHRFEQAINQAPNNNVQDLLNHLKERVSDFVATATPHDDMTIVVLKL